jgi:NitT/TauT family transport system ATP-binding protein
MGIFDRYGLNVALSRELGWASVRDKIYYGELDAAQSIAGIAFALGLGFSELRCEVAVPLILNLHGNAITLSNHLKPADIGRHPPVFLPPHPAPYLAAPSWTQFA